MALRGKALASLSFSKLYRNGHLWTCLCCGAIVSQLNGNTDLCNRVLSKHINGIAERHENQYKQLREMFSSLIFDRKNLTIHVWIERVVLCLHLFSFVKNETFRHHFKYVSICHKMHIASLHKLMHHVDSKIKATLAVHIATVLDGWSSCLTLFVGMFATYPSGSTGGYNQKLFAFSTLGN